MELRHPVAEPAQQPEKAAMSTRVVRLLMHLNLALQYALLLGVVLGVSQYLLAPSTGRIAALEGGVLSGIVVSVIVGGTPLRSGAGSRVLRRGRPGGLVHEYLQAA